MGMSVMFTSYTYSLTWAHAGAYCKKLLPEKNSGYFNQFFSYGKVNVKVICLPESLNFTRFFSPVKVYNIYTQIIAFLITAHGIA